MSSTLAAQPQPPTQSERKDDADEKAADAAEIAPEAGRDKAVDAERRKPKRDADRKALPEREREEEDVQQR